MYCSVLCWPKSWVGHRCHIPKPPYTLGLKNVDFMYLGYLIMRQHIIKGFSQLIRHFLDLQLFSIDLVLRQEKRWLSCTVPESAVMNDFYAKKRVLRMSFCRGCAQLLIQLVAAALVMNFIPPVPCSVHRVGAKHGPIN
jgi:hypothetical protein